MAWEGVPKPRAGGSLARWGPPGHGASRRGGCPKGCATTGSNLAGEGEGQAKTTGQGEGTASRYVPIPPKPPHIIIIFIGPPFLRHTKQNPQQQQTGVDSPTHSFKSRPYRRFCRPLSGPHSGKPGRSYCPSCRRPDPPPGGRSQSPCDKKCPAGFHRFADN